MENKFKYYIEKISEVSDIIEDNKFFDNKDVIECYSFNYNEKKYYVTFSNSFPGSLPTFYDGLPHKHTHISAFGEICIDRVEDIFYNTENIEDIIKKSFNSFFDVVNHTPSQEDYYKEYGDYIKYFKRYKYKNSYMLSNLIQEKVQIIEVYSSGKSYYYKSIDDERTYINNLNLKSLTYSKAIYIQMETPFEIKEIGSELMLFDIKIHLTTDTINECEKLLKYVRTKEIICSVTNPNGLPIYLSFVFQEKLRNLRHNITILNISQLKCVASNFLKIRGYAHRFSDKIFLIGLGSVGSEILYHLCKTGFDNIDVCDFDSIEATNIYRHFLGFSHALPVLNNNIVPVKKTVAMKLEMESRYPSVKINTYEDKIEKLLNLSEIDLSKYDFILNATGNMVSNLFLNNYLYKNKISSKVVYAWLEPFGVAGHIFTQNTAQSGCIACLLKSKNYVKLAKRDNYLIQNDNCLGSFTKYGSLDVSKLAIEVVKKIMKKQFYLSVNQHKIIVGDFNDFLDSGHELSEFASLSEDEINRKGEDIIYEGCEICGGHHY